MVNLETTAAPRKVLLSVAQTRFMGSGAPVVALTGGVGSGKTFSGMMKARQKILAGEPGAIVAPDFPHFARSTWDAMETWLPWSYCENKELNHPYTKEQILRFNVGGKQSKIWYGSMENVEAWTGMNLNWFFFDECKREKTRRAFDVLVSRLRVGEWPQGYLSSTPLGENHWLYDVCVKKDFPEEVMAVFREAGYDGEMVDWIKSKTKDNERNLPKTYVAMLQALYTGKLARQELEGEFINMAGAIWEEFSDKLEQGNVTVKAEYNPSVPVEWWMDDGFVEKHPRVVLFAQVVPPYVNIFDEYLKEGEYPEDTIKHCLGMHYRSPEVVRLDSTAAELRSKLWDANLDTTKASHDVEQGLLHVGPFILDGNGIRHLRFHPRCVRSIQAIRSYSRDDETLKPAKLGDDVPDALRYGLWNKSVPELDEMAARQSAAKQADMNAAEAAPSKPIEHYWEGLSMEQQAIYRWNNQYRQLR